MRPGSVRIPGAQRWLLFALLAISWLSGVSFFVLNTWVTIEGEFGPEKHPWQFGVLKTHGAAAFLMMIGFGFLLASHVPPGWRIRRMRPLGLVLVSAVALQIITAYLLYYLGDETFRQSSSYVHSFIGVSLPLVLLAHLRQGVRRRKPRGSRRREVAESSRNTR
ncbi:MAG: hypothetical protein AAF657_14515 [Acidobacteriota bacterium]